MNDDLISRAAAIKIFLAVIWLGIGLCKDIREEMEKGKKNEG